MAEEKTIALYNRGKRPFLLEYTPGKGYKKYLEPGMQAVVEEGKAAKLLKMYKRDIVKVADMPKTSAASIAQIKNLEDKLTAATAKIVELEGTIKELLADSVKKAEPKAKVPAAPKAPAAPKK